MATEMKLPDLQKMTADSAATARKFAEDGTVQARVMLDQATAQASKATDGLMKASEDAAEFGRANLDAMSRAAQAYTNGLQELGRHSMATMQSLTEQAMEAAKAIAAAKTLKEAAELQATYVRTTFDRLVAEQGKLQSVMQKSAEAAFAPISARVGATMEQVSRPLAA